MASTEPSSFRQLPLGLALQIDAIARRAERAWRDGSTTNVEAYLREISVEGRAALLQELLLLEADELRRRGEETNGEGWLTRFPDFPIAVQRAQREWQDSEQSAAGTSQTPQLRHPRIRGYTIERELGRGAMGVVYLARQHRPARLVALKIVASGFDLSKAFDMIRAEAQTIARLRHPNIVQVYEVGKDHGIPFLTIEFVDGESLRERLARGRLSPREAAELLEQLARAMHHAHALGVVHRDLKPANILLPRISAENAEQRVAPAGPKITDFGLAKLLDVLHEQTMTGSVLGTPKYMSPEQAEGRSREIGPPADVYALGVIAFEMLTGRAPFEAESSLKLLQQITETEATFSANEAREVPPDLQAICLKCLEKSPVRRYASALELADDVRRHLDDFPVSARRPSRIVLLSKFARRNRVLVVSLVMVLAAIVAGSLGTAFFAIRESNARWQSENVASRERDARARIEALLREERENIYWANLRLAQQAWEGGRLDRMRELLQQVAPQDASDPDLRGFEWHYLSRLSQPYSKVLDARPNEGRIAFSPDRRFIATTFGRGGVGLWNAVSGELVRELKGHADYVMDVAFSSDGSKLASVSLDGTARIWDVSSAQTVQVLQGHQNPVRSVAFSPDGRFLVTADEREKVILWSVEDWREVWSLRRSELYVMDLDYSPDNRRIVLGCGDGAVLLLDAATGAEEKRFQAGHGLWLTGVAFSPDGRRLATCGGDKTAKIWDLSSCTQMQELRGHADWLTGVTFDHEGVSITTSSRDGTLKIWDSATGRVQVMLKGHSNWAMSVAYSADGKTLASGSLDGTVRLWSPRADWESLEILLKPRDAVCLGLADSGATLLVGTRDGSVLLVDRATGKIEHAIAAHSLFVSSLAVSPGGNSFATASHDHTVKVWDVHTLSVLLELKGHVAEVNSVVYDPIQPRIVSSSRDGKICVWDAGTGQLLVEKRLAESAVHSIAFSPDGKILAAGGPQDISLWDTSTWDQVGTLKGHTRSVLYLAYSHDGNRIAACGSDQTVRVWNPATGEALHTLRGHTGNVTGLSFSRDGRRLVSCSQDASVRLWDTNSGSELMAFTFHTDWVNAVAMSPDDQFIASGSNDHTIRICCVSDSR